MPAFYRAATKGSGHNSGLLPNLLPATKPCPTTLEARQMTRKNTVLHLKTPFVYPFCRRKNTECRPFQTARLRLCCCVEHQWSRRSVLVVCCRVHSEEGRPNGSCLPTCLK